MNEERTRDEARKAANRSQFMSNHIYDHKSYEDGFYEGMNQALRQPPVMGSFRFSEREVDFAYLCGVFNASGIDGLHKEIQRLKELGKEPHDIIEACRNQ